MLYDKYRNIPTSLQSASLRIEVLETRFPSFKSTVEDSIELLLSSFNENPTSPDVPFASVSLSELFSSLTETYPDEEIQSLLIAAALDFIVELFTEKGYGVFIEDNPLSFLSKELILTLGRHTYGLQEKDPAQD